MGKQQGVAITVLLIVIILTGCATQKTLTREEALNLRNEQIAATTRIYQDVTHEDVLIAVDKLWRLADGSDFQITHTENAIMATRHWLFYFVIGAVFGVDNWYVLAEQNESDVKVSVRVNTSAAPLAPVPVAGTTNTAFSVTTLPPIESTVQGGALYAIFYARLDYLLGKSTEWWDCSTAAKKIAALNLAGNTDPLCFAPNMKDRRPEGVSK